jgi:SET domain
MESIDKKHYMDIDSSQFRTILKTQHVKLRKTKEQGVHVVATSRLQKGELIAEIQLEKCLNLDPSNVLKDLLGKGVPPVCCSALILAKCLKFPTSEFELHAKDLLELPLVPNVLRWKDSTSKLLQGTTIESAVKSMPLRSRFNEFILPYLKSTKNEFSVLFKSLTEDEFITACTLLMSRSFHGPGSPNASFSGKHNEKTVANLQGPWFLPGIDWFNHSSSATDIGVAVSFIDGKSFAVHAVRDINANEHVFISYGELSDAQLFQTYGFVDFMKDQKKSRWNIHDYVDVNPKLIVSTLAGMLEEEELELLIETRNKKSKKELTNPFKLSKYHQAVESAQRVSDWTSFPFILQPSSTTDPTVWDSSESILEICVPQTMLSVVDYIRRAYLETELALNSLSLRPIDTPSKLMKRYLSKQLPEDEASDVFRVWEIVAGILSSKLDEYPSRKTGNDLKEIMRLDDYEEKCALYVVYVEKQILRNIIIAISTELDRVGELLDFDSQK